MPTWALPQTGLLGPLAELQGRARAAASPARVTWCVCGRGRPPTGGFSPLSFHPRAVWARGRGERLAPILGKSHVAGPAWLPPRLRLLSRPSSSGCVSRARRQRRMRAEGAGRARLRGGRVRPKSSRGPSRAGGGLVPPRRFGRGPSPGRALAPPLVRVRWQGASRGCGLAERAEGRRSGGPRAWLLLGSLGCRLPPRRRGRPPKRPSSRGRAWPRRGGTAGRQPGGEARRGEAAGE